MSKKILFIDRDGTLIEEPSDFQVDALDKIRFVTDVIPSLLELSRHGFRFVMVSNQDGLGTASFPTTAFDTCQQHIVEQLASQGIHFDEIFICPHLPDDGCDCRKPRAGLLTKYLAATDINLPLSAVIGDRDTDMGLAQGIGVQGLLVNSKDAASTSWPAVVELLCHSNRVATVTRNTNETQISVTVNLDSAKEINIETGIGFFDHMLEQLAKHGGFGLQLRCDGDLQIDEHHTVEDTAICLGNALREALDEKVGIGRYGFVLPMDESKATVTVDLSGRAAFAFSAEFDRSHVGELSTEMVEHFFRSLSETLGAALHIGVEGENTHHMIEATFKAVGRSLRQAISRSGSELPTTKGTLNG